MPPGRPRRFTCLRGRHVLSDEDINRIADYLWSKQQKKKDAW